MTTHLQNQLFQAVHAVDPGSPTLLKMCLRVGISALFWGAVERDGAETWKIIRPYLDRVDAAERKRLIHMPEDENPSCSSVSNLSLDLWLAIFQHAERDVGSLAKIASLVSSASMWNGPAARLPKRFIRSSISSRVPDEIWLEVIKHADVISLGKLAATSSWWHCAVHTTIDSAMKRVFSQMDFDYDALRLCLTTTKAILSGTVAHRLLHLDHGAFCLDGVTDISFFVPSDGADWTGHAFFAFFRNAFGWSTDIVRDSTVPSVLAVVHLVHPCSPFRIKAHVCVGEVPLVTSMRTPLTTHFVAYDGDTLLVPHYALTVEDIALPNRSYVRLPAFDITAGGSTLECEAARSGIRIRPFSDAAPRDYRFHTTLGSTTRSFTYDPLALGRHRVPKRQHIMWRLGRPGAHFFVAQFPTEKDDWQLADDEEQLQLEWEEALTDPA
ncbi:hypothetical protein C8F01DRAFT_1320894 [Mycena amicta]|nr:hypothetical protein C8F01DRAFT_1320894 [Mycena amicta]